MIIAIINYEMILSVNDSSNKTQKLFQDFPVNAEKVLIPQRHKTL